MSRNFIIRTRKTPNIRTTNPKVHTLHRGSLEKYFIYVTDRLYFFPLLINRTNEVKTVGEGKINRGSENGVGSELVKVDEELGDVRQDESYVIFD